MARSVHTDPVDIRAARRLAEPRAARGAGDARRRHRLARRAKQQGMQVDARRPLGAGPALRIRLIWRAPGCGYRHPAEPAEVVRLLRQLPPRYRYKLRSVELRPAPPRRRGNAPLLGRLVLPGRVILYAQPCSPWLLRGLPSDAEQQRLRRAGAVIDIDRRSCLTVVTWPEHSLRDFMLYDVLIHELAHHALQVRHAQMAVSTARGTGHERTAIQATRREAARLVERG